MKLHLLLIFLLQGSLFALASVKPELIQPKEGSYLLIVQSLPEAGHRFGPNVSRARIEKNEEGKYVIYLISGDGTEKSTEFIQLTDGFYFSFRNKIKYHLDDEEVKAFVVSSYTASIATYEFEGKKHYEGLLAHIVTPQRDFQRSHGEDRIIYDAELREERFTLLEWPDTSKPKEQIQTH